jgi:hypothetical protein
MQFNTRDAMLRGLELRRKLGSWEEVEKLGRSVEDTIDAIRPPSPRDERSETGARTAE